MKSTKNNVKKMFIAMIIVFFFVLTSFGQISISGKIMDESNVPIPYVNIGIKEQGIGTITDREGKFQITLPDKFSNSMISISHVGYKQLNFEVAKMPKEIFLKSHPINLKPITVISKKYKRKVLGNQSKGGLFMSGFSKGDMGGEIGRKFSIKQPSIIEKMGFYVKYNDYDSVILRLKIYTINKKLPDKLISSENLIQISDRSTGHIELTPNIPIEVKVDIIITLELVEHFPADRGHIYFSQSPPFLGNMYYRATSFDKVKKYIGGPMCMYINIKY